MKILFLIAVLSFTCLGQDAPKTPDEVKPEPEKCIHDTDESFYDALRHTQPINITHADGRSITVVIYKKNLIEHKTFIMARQARIPKNFYVMDIKKRWFLLYCSLHNTVWVAEPLK